MIGREDFSRDKLGASSERNCRGGAIDAQWL